MGRHKPVRKTYASSTADEEVLREELSEGFRAYTDDAAARGVRYFNGHKDGITDIDCSGFVEKAVRKAFADYLTNGDRLERPGDKNQSHFFDTGADDQVMEVGKYSRVLSGDDVNLKSLKAGMIVGMDVGPVDWAKGRDLHNNISHIVLIYEDPKGSGRLRVGQSSPKSKEHPEGGVHSEPLEDWYKRVHGAGFRLYATDVVPVIAAYGAEPKTQIAAAPPAAEMPSVFSAAFPDVAAAFGIVSPRPDQTTAVPGVKPAVPATAPAAQKATR